MNGPHPHQWRGPIPHVHKFTPYYLVNRDNFKTAVKEELLSRAETLFRELIGEPAKANSHDWRAKGRSSFSLAMRGPNRGLWKDYSSGKGGDLFDLIAVELCGLDRAAADIPETLAIAANWVGISKDQSIDQGDLKAQQKIRASEAVKAEAVQVAHRVRLITDLQAKAQPIKGTPAAVYLASRGIVNLPDTALAYLPAVSVLGIKHPHCAALCIWGIDDNGEASGGQRVLIMPDGSKAPEDTHKASFGAIQGDPARFCAQALGGPLCVAEGPESALYIWQATGFETSAVFGVSGFKGARLPHGRKVVLCPDQDAPDSPAGQQFTAAVKHYIAEGYDILIAPAPEPEGSKRDLNDTLQRAGNAAVFDAIAAAYNARPRPGPPTPYRVKLLKAADLPDNRKETLLAEMVAAPQDEALAVAVAVAQVMQFRAPVVYTAQNIAATIKHHMGDRLSETEICAVEKHVAWIQGQRRQTVLARSMIDHDAAKRHDMVTVMGLDQIDLLALKEVVLIKAPMGAGKTQLVGRPFITAAKKAGGGVMAIAHRVTLIEELAHRLDLPNYQSDTIQDDIMAAGGVAVCLPSITRQDIERLIPAPRFIFIDEIAQVLQFLAEDKFCRSGGGTNYGVYERLQQIFRQAETVVVADADLDMRTFHFLEECRPNERFKIIEMQTTPSGKNAVVYAEGAAVLSDIAIELAAGGKVWLACEGAKRAAALAARNANLGFKVICIRAETKLNAEQQAFCRTLTHNHASMTS